MEIATFGAGCFWHVESMFQHTKGVTKTTVGYMGGTKEHPTYEDVCSHTTGHAEVVQLEYDPKQITYDELLNVFWELHDPTQVNRQGSDVGTQYRSVIFYHNETQKKQAELSKEKQQHRHRFKKIETEITPASTFWKAENYHQHYFEKNGLASCKI